MADRTGNLVELRAYVDPKDGKHKLETHPEGLRICKRKVRVLGMAVKNETVGTPEYKPVVLGFHIRGGSAGKSQDPSMVFDDAPNFPGGKFIVRDDGKPCYFTIKKHLGLKERKKPCTFPDEDPGEYAVFVNFSHEGWDDAFGSGDHEWWHIES